MKSPRIRLRVSSSGRLLTMARRMTPKVVCIWVCFEELVEHHLGLGVPAQLEDHPHPVAVALVADVGDAVYLALLDQLGTRSRSLALLTW